MSLDFSFETRFQGMVAGIDEAGRGPWAGPVVAACVILDKRHLIEGINDSKKLSKAKREIIFEALMLHAKVGIGIASVSEIDNVNILAATKIAMQRSYIAMGHKADIILVDGNQLPAIDCSMEAVVRGDTVAISIAAASIIAKVTRDTMMKTLAKEFPYYGWEKNAGYGTRVHQEGLSQYGITPHHRRSFTPIKNLHS